MNLLRVAAAALSLAVVAGCGDTATPSTAGAPPGASAPPGAGASTPVTESLSTPPAAESDARMALPSALRRRVPVFPPPPPVTTQVTLPEDGRAANFTRIPTTDKVAFVTIDDGWEKDPRALQLLRAANVPVTLFLEVDAVKGDPKYFTALQSAGATIENHTISHPILTGLGYDAQKRQICGGADRLASYYGRRPTLFRPPGGNFNATTLRAVHDCGMLASFTWMESADKGKFRFQPPQKVVAPGDIILMHFRPAFVDDFLVVLNAIHKAGLTPARLEDYVPGAAATPAAG